jgi:serine phosphatase RsbU (regulator of sigma subunit)
VGKGDTLVILTDGLTEVFDGKGEECGEERIEQILVAKAEKPLTEIYSAIMTTVRDFGSQEDDQTLLLARVR